MDCLVKRPLNVSDLEGMLEHTSDVIDIAIGSIYSQMQEHKTDLLIAIFTKIGYNPFEFTESQLIVESYGGVEYVTLNFDQYNRVLLLKTWIEGPRVFGDMQICLRVESQFLPS